MKRISLTFLIFLLCSCAISNVKDKSEFRERWIESKRHTAVSWWYAGETEIAYYITEKRLINHYSYEIPKTMIKLVDIEKFSPCKACKGKNLKFDNIKFLEKGL